MRKYETIFVIDSLLKSEEIENNINKYERFISANGGHIEEIERWGKKRLAYEVKRRQYGYYVLIRFDGLPGMIKPLEREYRLNESLLRYKTLLLSKGAIKNLAHGKKAFSITTSDEEVDTTASAKIDKKSHPVEKRDIEELKSTDDTFDTGDKELEDDIEGNNSSAKLEE